MNTLHRSPVAGSTILAIAAFLGACTPPATPAEQRSSSLARPASRGPERLALQGLPRVPTSAGVVVLRGAWGAGPTQFGRHQEASNPGPMALDVDRHGRVHILDQVNRRVKRYSARGALQALVPLHTRGVAEYLRADEDGRLYALALEPGQPQQYWLHDLVDTGRRMVPLALPPRAYLPTGIFFGPSGEVWVEHRHKWQYRLPDGARELGRPDISRPGARVLASRAGKRLARVSRVLGGRYTSTLFEVQTPLPLLAIQELAADRRGAVYLALLMGRESGPPAWDLDEVSRVMFVRDPGGAHRVVQLEHGRVTDCNRDLAVSPGGDLYQLHTTEAELRVRRWRLSR